MSWVKYKKKSSNILLVAFSYYGVPHGKFGFEHALDELGYDLLLLNSDDSSYYIDGIEGIGKDLDEITQYVHSIFRLGNYQNLILFGSSMGAYPALYCGANIKGSITIAFGAKYSLKKHSDVKNSVHLESRFSGWDVVLKNTDLNKVFIFNGDFDDRDRESIKYFSRSVKHAYVVKNKGHQIIADVSARYGFGTFIESICIGAIPFHAENLNRYSQDEKRWISYSKNSHCNVLDQISVLSETCDFVGMAKEVRMNFDIFDSLKITYYAYALYVMSLMPRPSLKPDSFLKNIDTSYTSQEKSLILFRYWEAMLEDGKNVTDLAKTMFQEVGGSNQQLQLFVSGKSIANDTFLEVYGNVDVVSENRISGWCKNLNLSGVTKVLLVDDSGNEKKVISDSYRQDLDFSKFDFGRVGFVFEGLEGINTKNIIIKEESGKILYQS